MLLCCCYVVVLLLCRRGVLGVRGVGCAVCYRYELWLVFIVLCFVLCYALCCVLSVLCVCFVCMFCDALALKRLMSRK